MIIHIPSTKERESLGRHLDGAPPEGQWSLEEVLSTLTGIRIVEKLKTLGPQSCDWYVFQQEPWYAAFMLFPENRPRLFLTGFQFLAEHGYELTDNPTNNDLAVYGWTETPDHIIHFGRYQNRKILSKFGTFSVFEHELEMVPAVYGNYATFLRKKSL